MRTAATHKVILNATVFKEMKIGDKDGNEPKGRQLLFSAHVDGSLVPCILKVSTWYLDADCGLTTDQMPKEEDVKSLYAKVKSVQEEL